MLASHLRSIRAHIPKTIAFSPRLRDLRWRACLNTSVSVLQNDPSRKSSYPHQFSSRMFSNLRPLDDSTVPKEAPKGELGRKTYTSLDEIPEDDGAVDIDRFAKDEKKIILEQIRTLAREEEERFRQHDLKMSRAFLHTGYVMIIGGVFLALYLLAYREEMDPKTAEYEDLYRVFDCSFMHKGILSIDTIIETLIKPESLHPPIVLKAPRATHKQLKALVPDTVHIPMNPIEAPLFPYSTVYALAHAMNDADPYRDYRIRNVEAVTVLESYLDLMGVALEQALTDVCADIKTENQTSESLIELKYRLSRPFFNLISKKKGDIASLVTQVMDFNAYADRDAGVSDEDRYARLISLAEVRLLAARIQVDIIAMAKRDLFRAMEITYKPEHFDQVLNRDTVKAPLMPITGNLEEVLEKQWQLALEDITNTKTRVVV